MKKQKLFSNPWFQIVLNPEERNLDFLDNKGRIVITEACFDYSANTQMEKVSNPLNFEIQTIKDDWGGKGKEIILKSQNAIEMKLILHVYPNRPYILFKQQIINSDSSPVILDSLFPLKADSTKGTSIQLGDIASNRVFVNTWGKTPATISDLLPLSILSKETDIRHTGFWDGAFYNRETKKSLVIGCLTAKRWVSRIHFEYKSLNHVNMICEQYLGEKSLAPGESEETEWWYLDYSTAILKNYLQYGQLVGKAMDAKKYDYSPAAFDVWHEYRDQFNEEVLLSNARFVKNHPQYFPVCPGGMEYILADLGWAKAIGQNEVDETKFPHGMKYVADEIHKLGLKAGTYMTPFWISSLTSVFEEHPEWLLKDKNGKTIIIRDFTGTTSAGILDCTHPGAQNYIREQIRLIIKEWGFDCLKIDFMERVFHEHFSESNSDKKPVFCSKNTTVVENYRLGCQIMMDEVSKLNPRAIVAPFTIPANPSIGIFPMNCTAEDAVHPYIAEPSPWGNHFGPDHQVRTWALRYWMHNQIWTSHSESILIREARPLNEAIFTTTAAALSGGMICVGDDLARLSKDRLRLVSKIFPLLGKTAIPVDLFEEINPKIWNLPIQKENRNWHIVGIFNWEIKENNIELDLSNFGLNKRNSYLIFEFWTQTFLGKYQGKINFFLPGRTVALTAIHKDLQRPQIIGTDVHYSQGAVEIKGENWDLKENILSIRFQNPRLDKSRLHIYHGKKYILKKITSSLKGIKIISDKNSIYTIAIPKSQQEIKFDLLFSKVK